MRMCPGRSLRRLMSQRCRMLRDIFLRLQSASYVIGNAEWSLAFGFDERQRNAGVGRSAGWSGCLGGKRVNDSFGDEPFQIKTLPLGLFTCLAQNVLRQVHCRFHTSSISYTADFRENEEGTLIGALDHSKGLFGDGMFGGHHVGPDD